MGVKDLFKEIGPGEKIALAKLSTAHYNKFEVPFRVAIDASIWSFQSQKFQVRQGSNNIGRNSDLRTLYYRLVNLLKLNIQSIFIFDGNNRPDFKRDKKISKREGKNLILFRQLVSLFGFPSYIAPGEAEAECAHLQKKGIVDAVWSEDVDTLLFGSRTTLKKCAKENEKSVPTHVTVHELQSIRKQYKITPEGMILIALLRGGDYDTEGVSKCGIAYAAGAAKHGYGEELIRACRRSDNGASLETWREELNDQIRTNKDKMFKARSSTITIPAGFPNREILGYYTNPLVSSTIPKMDWGRKPNVRGLREYTVKHFGWSGTGKFIATFSPAFLSYLLASKAPGVEDLVHEVANARENKATDNRQELRVKYRPVDVVKLEFDPDQEPAAKTSELISSQHVEVSDAEDDEADEADGSPENADTASKDSIYDPREVHDAWILREWVELGAIYQFTKYKNAKVAREQAKIDKLQAKKDGVKKPVKKKMPLQSNVITNYYNTSKIDDNSEVAPSNRKAPPSSSSLPAKAPNPPKASLPVLTSPAKKRNAVSTSVSQSLEENIPRPSRKVPPRSTMTRQATRSPTKPRATVQEASNTSIKNTLKSSKISGNVNPAKVQKYAKVVLRESLEGSWKPDTGARSTGCKTYENVEIVDMTDA